jgi:rod shape-determining protein MreC
VRYRKYVLLVSVALVSLVLLTLESRGQGSASLSDLISRVTTPFQTGLTKLHQSGSAVWTTYLDWKQFRGENRALRAEVERLRIASLQVRDTQEENLRLRRLLGLRDRLPLSTLAGEVIAKEWSGWIRSLIVNRGRRDGIARMTPVIVPEGLVGRVAEVRSGAVVVQLINDPSSSVGAVVQQTRTVGVVEGEPGGGMRFKFLARESGGLRVGDLIVTSGLGGMFPKGLPVGRITALEDHGLALFHYARISPMTDLARVEEVLLLVGQSSADLLSYFQTSAS